MTKRHHFKAAPPSHDLKAADLVIGKPELGGDAVRQSFSRFAHVRRAGIYGAGANTNIIETGAKGRHLPGN